VARTGTARGGLIQESEFAGLLVDGEGARRAAFLRAEMVDFVYGIKIFATGFTARKEGSSDSRRRSVR